MTDNVAGRNDSGERQDRRRSNAPAASTPLSAEARVVLDQLASEYKNSLLALARESSYGRVGPSELAAAAARARENQTSEGEALGAAVSADGSVSRWRSIFVLSALAVLSSGAIAFFTVFSLGRAVGAEGALSKSAVTLFLLSLTSFFVAYSLVLIAFRNYYRSRRELRAAEEELQLYGQMAELSPNIRGAERRLLEFMKGWGRVEVGLRSIADGHESAGRGASALPLGSLLVSLVRAGLIDNELEGRVKSSLKKRNEVVHSPMAELRLRSVDVLEVRKLAQDLEALPRGFRRSRRTALPESPQSVN